MHTQIFLPENLANTDIHIQCVVQCMKPCNNDTFTTNAS